MWLKAVIVPLSSETSSGSAPASSSVCQGRSSSTCSTPSVARTATFIPFSSPAMAAPLPGPPTGHTQAHYGSERARANPYPGAVAAGVAAGAAAGRPGSGPPPPRRPPCRRRGARRRRGGRRRSAGRPGAPAGAGGRRDGGVHRVARPRARRRPRSPLRGDAGGRPPGRPGRAGLCALGDRGRHRRRPGRAGRPRAGPGRHGCRGLRGRPRCRGALPRARLRPGPVGPGARRERGPGLRAVPQRPDGRRRVSGGRGHRSAPHRHRRGAGGLERPCARQLGARHALRSPHRRTTPADGRGVHGAGRRRLGPRRGARRSPVRPLPALRSTSVTGGGRRGLAIIGGGKIGEALLSGLVRRGGPDGLLVCERSPERAAQLAERYRVPALDPGEAAARARGEGAARARLLLLAVKPQDIDVLLAALAEHVDSGHLVVSVAAGVPTARIEAALPVGTPVVRVMPNTPALVDEGMSVLSAGAHAGEEHLDEAEALLAAVGRVRRVPESQQDAVTALSGSGPAYFFYLVEAMVDAGILLGLPRALAADLIVQTALGSAVMMRDSGEHPVQLREAVTSPGGTTIAAIREL